MLKLKRFQEGRWFDYPKAEGVRFLIRPLQLSEGMKIRSKLRHVIPVDVKNSRTKQPVTTLMEDVNSSDLMWAIFDHILQDFEGISIEDEKGDVVGSTKDEMKKAIFDNEELREFITEKSEWLLNEGEKKLEDEIKN